jgi:L-lactate dehydrogenase complex protein LldG
MSKKEDILSRYRANIKQQFDMPSLDDIKGITYPDPLVQFISISEGVGGKVVELEPGKDINDLIRELYPEAKEIASNLPEITIATRNPDTIGSPQALNNTDVGVIRGMFGVAENGCIWIPQQMVEKAVCFISENLVILLKKSEIVNNMHEAYKRIEFNDYGYGTFISDPSKTADIAQVLVMGAQAARSATVVLMP